MVGQRRGDDQREGLQQFRIVGMRHQRRHVAVGQDLRGQCRRPVGVGPGPRGDRRRELMSLAFQPSGLDVDRAVGIHALQHRRGQPGAVEIEQMPGRLAAQVRYGPAREQLAEHPRRDFQRIDTMEVVDHERRVAGRVLHRPPDRAKALQVATINAAAGVDTVHPARLDVAVEVVADGDLVLDRQVERQRVLPGQQRQIGDQRGVDRQAADRRGGQPARLLHPRGLGVKRRLAPGRRLPVVTHADEVRFDGGQQVAGQDPREARHLGHGHVGERGGPPGMAAHEQPHRSEGQHFRPADQLPRAGPGAAVGAPGHREEFAVLV